MNFHSSWFSRPTACVKFSSRMAAAAALLLVVGLPGALRGAEKGVQAELDALSSKRQAAIETESKPLNKVVDQYKLALQQFKSAAQAGGDLDGMVAANKALEDLAQGPAFSPLSNNPKIAKIQQTYQKSYDDLKSQLEGRLVEVDRNYSNQLDAMVKELTRAGMVEEALKVRNIREKFIEDYKAAKAANTPTPKIPDKPVAAPPSKFVGTRAGEERDFEIAPGVKMKMCWIPPGEFVMGSAKDELGHQGNETQHKVTLTKGFWLGKYEVRQDQWQAVMDNNPSQFKGKDHPVEKVSWNDISNPGGFLEKVNQKAASGERFHLPTEAQWEYACRAGTKTSLNSGKDITTVKGNCRDLDKIAWYGANSEGKTHPVGQKKPNAWGLHDMHGNVWEWCADWNGAYPAEPSTDPVGAETGAERVVRGGGWDGNAPTERCAHRNQDGPSDASNYRIGFRLARSTAP